MADKKKKIKKSRPPPSWQKSIDLHGMRVEEALAELDRFLNHCILEQEVHKVEIVHGVGTGRLKKAVQDYLQGLKVISEFHVDPMNPGATWVEL